MEEKPALSPADTEATTHSSAPQKGKKPSATFELIKQKWREYVIEILVIIIGITLSFALNTWKEQQGKKELEQVYLKSLYSDITSDIGSLQEIINETEQVVSRAKSLLAYSQQDDLTGLNQAQFFVELQEVFDRPNFVSNDATFTDLKSSGNMQVLSDFELKNSLFNYYTSYEAVKAVEVAERDAALFIVIPYMTKRFSFGDSNATSKSKEAIAATLKDTEFINGIFIRLDNRQELLGEYKDLLFRSQK